jgi:hypothetical protein
MKEYYLPTFLAFAVVRAIQNLYHKTQITVERGEKYEG